MNRLVDKTQHIALRKHRVRARITGTAERPRLSIRITNLHITAQLIDDVTSTTLVYATTVGNKKLTGTMTEKAQKIGEEITVKAKASKIQRVVFDRGAKLYHGRIKALAEAARAQGLEF